MSSQNRTGGIVGLCVVLAALSAVCVGCADRPARNRQAGEPEISAIDISAPFSDKNIYTVCEGDTLYSIARDVYGQTERWQLLFYANRDLIDTPEDLAPGMKIYVPSKDTTLTYEHTVAEGDTLSKLALKFYSDRSKAGIIADYNNLKDPDYITPGQRLTIPILR